MENMFCERSFENLIKKNGDDDYFLLIFLFISVIVVVVIFSFLYEIILLNSVVGFIFLFVFGFVMYLIFIIFCIIWKVLDKINCFLMLKVNYYFVVDLVLIFLWILSLGNLVYFIFIMIVCV